MYVVIETGGKQYKVEEGSTILVEKLNHIRIGEVISLNNVLLLSDCNNILIGTPYLNKIKVTAKVISQSKSPKIFVFKQKAKKGYKKLKGHRQNLTEIKILKICTLDTKEDTTDGAC
ncbi:MAG: 50S ribosomal protein L21 [Endomicrobium sp.]|jgi:large subunit ribosomal protein L21|nr:50S ribosomal protein L21 [Endomicrobium sp.]